VKRRVVVEIALIWVRSKRQQRLGYRGHPSAWSRLLIRAHN
jgi:hypothetical protein